MSNQPFDSQLEALTYEIEWLVTHEWREEANRQREHARLTEEFKKAEKFPLNQMTPSVWDRLNKAAQENLL